MKNIWIVAVAVCVLGLVTSAQAAKGGKKNKNATTEDVFKKYDANGDGKLDDSEKAAIKSAFDTDYSLRKYDTNGDSKLDDNEIAGIQPQASSEKKKGKRKK